jgi:F-type H+-transporting ATPase subunit epsilon
MLLEIITAERQVYSDDVEVVVAPGVEGELGILPHHAPLMTALKPGEIMVRKNGQQTYLAVSGGFMEVMGNKVTILADTCERSDEIDEARAQVAMQRAKEQLARRGATMEMERALAAVRRAEVRLNVARRRRGREQAGVRPGGGPSGSA